MARLMQQSTLSLFTFHFHCIFSIFQFEYKYKLRRLASDVENNEMGKQENGQSTRNSRLCWHFSHVIVRSNCVSNALNSVMTMRRNQRPRIGSPLTMMMMRMTMMIAIVLPMALLSMRPKLLIYDAAAPSWVCTALDKYYCKWARDECTHSAPRKSTDNKCQRHCHMVWHRLPLRVCVCRRICIRKVTDE